MGSYRIDKMSSTVRAIVSDLVANKLNDPRISRFASITRVETSGDLQIAKVYVSVLGSASESERTLRGLRRAARHIQRLLARQLETRHCPVLRFLPDPAIKGAAETIRIINESVAADEQHRECRQEPLGTRPDEED